MEAFEWQQNARLSHLAPPCNAITSEETLVTIRHRGRYLFDILQACELLVQFTTNKSLAE